MNPFSIITPKNRHLSQRGNVLFAIMAGAAGIATLSVIIFNVVPIFRKQVVRSQDFFSASVALNSVADYTIFGIRNRWCFTDSWLQDPNCSLTHTKNSERLLLSNDAIQAIYQRSVDTGHPIDVHTIGLTHIEQTIIVNSLSSAHPLYMVLSNLRGNRKADDSQPGDQRSERLIKITIDRVTSLSYPTRGREAIIRVKVTLQESNPLMMLGKYLRKDQLSVESVISIYPRELSSFALIIANDLHLDEDLQSSTGLPTSGYRAVGDFYVPKMTYQDALDQGIVGVGGSGGLYFNSPVFANGNLVLPPDENPISKWLPPQQLNLLNYAPITFADKVVLGNGFLMRHGHPARPLSAGSSIDKFNGQAVDFGGLLRGVETDGFRDAGLDVLSNAITGTIDQTKMRKCIAINNSKLELPLSKSLVAMAKEETGSLVTSDSVSRKYLMGMSGVDFLKSITANVKIYDTSGNNVSGTPTLTPGTSTTSVARVKVRLVAANIATLTTPIEVISHAQMERGEKFTVVPNFKPDFVAALTAVTTQYAASCTPPASGASCSTLLQRKTDLTALVANYGSGSLAPRIELSLNPVKLTATGKTQPHVLEMQASITGRQYFQAVEVEPELFESAYAVNGSDIMSSRRVNPPPATTIFSSSEIDRHTRANPAIDLLADFGTVYKPIWSANLTAAGVNISDLPEDTYDYASLEEECNQAGGLGGGAFGIADWDTSYASVARSSWSFRHAPPRDDAAFILSGNNSALGNPAFPPSFQVASISGDCVIRASANFVTGFFNCDHLVIETRTTPLRIIGTFIVTGGWDSARPAIYIHPNAYKAGIKWSNIYEPNAVLELQAARILKPGSAAPSCKDIPDDPIWHPYPNIQGLSDTFKCSPMSLRFGKDPFTWTQVDPDCGGTPSAPGNSCKKRAMRFIFRELDRRDSL